MALRISKNLALTDISSLNEKPFLRKSDGAQVDYHEILNYPSSPDMTLYNPNPAYNPITTQHQKTGQVTTLQLWLFNDQSAKRYEGISIDPTDSIGTDESTYVQLAPDSSGSAGTFLSVGAPLTIANINDWNVAKPFWIRVTTPSVVESQNKTDIKLTTNFTEFAL
ncbi:hypothetical protein ACFQZE_07400 [Paenibacillus sp. GCM10027627]|uniref:hypothetical protein n=1 Tax=unclassified Paenibacillus TaxID=185978 RepID=UPI0036430FA0